MVSLPFYRSRTVAARQIFPGLTDSTQSPPTPAFPGKKVSDQTRFVKFFENAKITLAFFAPPCYNASCVERHALM